MSGRNTGGHAPILVARVWYDSGSIRLPLRFLILHQAELAGGLALDKLIEDATEALEHDEGLREMTGLLPSAMAGLLPPITAGGGGGGANHSPAKLSMTLRKTAANRCVAQSKFYIPRRRR
jgi:hypothetical protein